MSFPSKSERAERRVVRKTAAIGELDAPCQAAVDDVSKFIHAAKDLANRSVNVAMTAA